jgi:hypothetical protein
MKNIVPFFCTWESCSILGSKWDPDNPDSVHVWTSHAWGNLSTGFQLVRNKLKGKDEKHAYEIGRFLLPNLSWHRNKKKKQLCYAMSLVVIPLQPHAQVAAPGLLMTILAKLQLQGMHLVLQLQRLRGQLLMGSLD